MAQPKTVAERINMLDRLYLESDRLWRRAMTYRTECKTKAALLAESRKVSRRYQRLVKQPIPKRMV